MNNIKLTLLILMFLPGIILAQKVEKIDAQKIAKEVYKRNNQGKDTKLRDVIILGDKNKKDTLLYIVPFEESGFAIVSAYRVAPPILGHCMKGEYEPNKMPPGLLHLINKYMYSITKLKMRKRNHQ